MREYSFQFRSGLEPVTILASNDEEFYDSLAAWESTTRCEHVPETIVCTVKETYKVPEPPNTPVKVDESPGSGSQGFDRNGKPNVEKLH